LVCGETNMPVKMEWKRDKDGLKYYKWRSFLWHDYSYGGVDKWVLEKFTKWMKIIQSVSQSFPRFFFNDFKHDYRYGGIDREYFYWFSFLL